jgi:hypothetical protein
MNKNDDEDETPQIELDEMLADMNIEESDKMDS